jgi:hypothetical protein
MCTIAKGSDGRPKSVSTRWEESGKFDAILVFCFSSDQNPQDLKDEYRRMDLQGGKFGRAVA